MLSPWLAGEIHHVGSTSVPGLGAKPVIELLAEVRSLERVARRSSRCSALSYHWFPYEAELMNWFCKPSPEYRTHHLHLVVRGSPAVAPRSSSSATCCGQSRGDGARLEELKRRLADEHLHDREAYTRPPRRTSWSRCWLAPEPSDRLLLGVAGLRRLADRDLVEPLAQLLGGLAELRQARQRGEALEPEDALEERRRAVANRPARPVVAPGLGDQAAVEQPGNGRVRGDTADPRDLRPAARAEVGDDREGLEGGLGEPALDRPLEEPLAGMCSLARGPERIAPRTRSSTIPLRPSR